MLVFLSEAFIFGGVILSGFTPNVLGYLQDALQSRGYRVQVAASGMGALALASAKGHQFDLLVTDVEMAGMSGVELVQAVVARNPGIKVLFVSGGGHDRLSELLEDEHLENLVHKPIKLESLLRAIRQLLD